MSYLIQDTHATDTFVAQNACSTKFVKCELCKDKCHSSFWPKQHLFTNILMFLCSHADLVTLIIPFKRIFEKKMFSYLKKPTVAAQSFNPSTRKVEADQFLLSLNPYWSTQWVPGQLQL